MMETKRTRLRRRMVVAAAESPPTQTHSTPQAQRPGRCVTMSPLLLSLAQSSLYSFSLIINLTLFRSRMSNLTVSPC